MTTSRSIDRTPLSEKERRVLYHAQLDARASIPELSRRCKLREHNTRYALDRLAERGVISREAFIDVYRLGYTLHTVYFSLATTAAAVRSRFFNELAAAQEVAWLREFGGDYRYGMDLCVRDVGALDRFMKRMADAFGGLIRSKTFATITSWTYFPRGYLLEKPQPLPGLTMSVVESASAADDIDLRILGALAAVGHSSHRALAAKLEMPLSTLEYRIRRLSEEQIYRGEIYSVDSTKFGMLPYKLLIFTPGISADMRSRITGFAAKHPNVCGLVECIGAWDFELNIEVESNENVGDLVEALHASCHPAPLDVRILPSLRAIKSRVYPHVS